MYDEAAERTVVAGAFQWGAYDVTADRWELIYERDPPGPAVQPWAYDPVNRRLLVWGSGYGDIVAFDSLPGSGRCCWSRDRGEEPSSAHGAATQSLPGQPRAGDRSDAHVRRLRTGRSAVLGGWDVNRPSEARSHNPRVIGEP